MKKLIWVMSITSLLIGVLVCCEPKELSKNNVYVSNLNATLCDLIQVNFALGKDEIPNKANFQLVYDENDFACYVGFDHPLSNNITNYLIPKRIGKFKIEVKYYEENWQYDVNINNVDKTKYKIIDNIDDISSFYEFTNLIKGIRKHEFTSPYIGLRSYSTQSYYDTSLWSYDFNEKEYDLDYLPYLLDDCFYPSYFPMLDDSKITSNGVNMYFPSEYDVKKDTSKKTMQNMSIYSSEIDPCCTNPQDRVENATFSCTSKIPTSNSSIFLESSFRNNNSFYSNLFKLYPDLFYSYEIFNDVDVNLLIDEKEGNFIALFEDAYYSYIVNVSYALDRMNISEI